MKIFNIEDNKEVVYVQLDDLATLMRSDEEIPAVIVTQVFGSGVVIINEDNNSEFVRFDEPVAVKFFKDADWIVDFKQCYHLSEQELFDHGQVTLDEMNEIAEQFNALPQEERKNHMDLKNRHELLGHKFATIPKVLWFKQGFVSIPIPEVIDSQGFTLAGDEKIPYEVKQGLNPMQSFLYRTDGKELDDKEIIPLGLIQSALSLLIMNNMECNEFFGDFDQTKKLSDDKKYFITSLRVLPKEEIKEEAVEKKDSKDTKLSLGKRVKNFFNGLLKG